MDLNSQMGVICRMHRDLVRTLAEPVEKRRWIVVIDLKQCVGCSAYVGSKTENHLPPSVARRGIWAVPACFPPLHPPSLHAL
jgi:molybdopterin-containing oxidoreductase family iron-sulfur binding subunit